MVAGCVSVGAQMFLSGRLFASTKFRSDVLTASCTDHMIFWREPSQSRAAAAAAASLCSNTHRKGKSTKEETSRGAKGREIIMVLFAVA